MVETGSPTWRRSRALWMAAAMCVAAIPFLRGLTGSRMFYLRDLSMFFWYRYLWLRRTILSGEWPLWDPYIGGGQSAIADAMHQMFLLPSLLVRFAGGEVLGFNLWVAVPFPLAALGAWLFFARRSSAHAATLGAIAFAVSGPIVSTGNFPNMSWSVAAIPWVLWAADRLVSAPGPRATAWLAVAVASQALAGEPVTFVVTAVLVCGFVLVVAGPEAPAGERRRIAAGTIAGFTLGGVLSAAQLLPMQQAVSFSQRSAATTQVQDFWSLHPLMLAETVSHNLFGDYITSQTITAVPWMRLLNSGRDPFFYSLYFGTPLIALALFGLVASRARRWSFYWLAVAVSGLVCAFGAYTPIYPFLRDHLPLLSSFRFPAKYLVVLSIAVAAGAASGWDILAGHASESAAARRVKRGRNIASAAALGIGVLAYIIAGLCLYFPDFAARRLYGLVRSLPVPQTFPPMPPPDPVDAAAFMLHALPHAATAVLLIALAAALLVWLSAEATRRAAFARYALFGLIVCDLSIRAWPVNPAIDPSLLAEPPWVGLTRADPDARFYIGGKRMGTFDTDDPDGARAFLSRRGLNGSENRAALNAQTLFYPSAWQAREIISHDLPVLWPRWYALAVDRFATSNRGQRDRFLRRAGVRYRIVADRAAAGHTPLLAIPFYLDSSLYDWGPADPRVSVVPGATIVPAVDEAIRMLFEAGWDSRSTALVDRDTAASGNAGAPLPASAHITLAKSNALTVEASAGAGGGYLVVLDSYSPDWRATVDGTAAPIVRANGLFRGVHLAPGPHTIEFRYRPQAFFLGAALSIAALVALAGLFAWPTFRRAQIPPVEVTAAPQV